MIKKFLLIVTCYGVAACNLSTEENVNERQLSPVLEKLWESDTLLTANESVIYDSLSNSIYVSCMGAMPDDAKDGDGFIAKLSLKGEIDNLSWITGLNCPKGLAIYGRELYVSDIDELVCIDLDKGIVISKTRFPEIDFINDIDISENGEIFLNETRKNKIYSLKNDSLSLFYSTEKLGGLNGVHSSKDGVFFTGSEGKIYALNDKVELRVAADSVENADGIEQYKSGYFASSWQGRIYYFTEGGHTSKLVDTWDNQIHSADIDVVDNLNLLLSPTLFNNKVIAYRIK
ncbi:MAG: ATP-binding protein [Cytophagales bacterium]|nr:ATP-binding protein [Cytophagales bacterium]